MTLLHHLLEPLAVLRGHLRRRQRERAAERLLRRAEAYEPGQSSLAQDLRATAELALLDGAGETDATRPTTRPEATRIYEWTPFGSSARSAREG